MRNCFYIGAGIVLAAAASLVSAGAGQAEGLPQPTNPDGVGALRVTPDLIELEDNLPRIIKDYTTDDELGVIQMLAPEGWTEPIVSLSFETRGIVLKGKLGLEFETMTQTFDVDSGFIIPRDTKVRIFNAGEGELHLIEILRPKYLPTRSQQFDSFD
jgi:mannose-6-phosphate isomerase-like protein (cupin superfamily)